MTASLWLRDVGAFGLQIAMVVGAGAALARAFRINQPRAMLAYWQVVLAVCLLLPLSQPWRHPVSPALETTLVATTPASEAAVPQAPAQTAWLALSWPREKVVLLVLASGLTARVLWLALGAFALRRLRREASPLVPLPETIRNAQERIGTAAHICVSDRTAGPITFGFLRPVVLFPPSVQTMAPHVQEAITYHELLHVRRRDWLCEVFEEAIRAVLWFHPAIWWLIGRIQLCREQVVDEDAIKLTASRDRYVDALLTVALDKSPMSFAPASPFLRRSLLKKRVAQILQETSMTTRRLIASLAASAAALGLAATLAVQSFPLQAKGRELAATPEQQESATEPIQIVKGGEHLLHAALPEYPGRAVEQRVEGDVLLDLSIDERGEVSDARVLSGPEELRKAALESALQWHYAPSALKSTSIEAVLRFHLPAAGANVEFGGRELTLKLKATADVTENTLSTAQLTEHRLDEIKRALEDPGTTEIQKVELKQKFEEATVMMAKIRAERGEGTERGFAVTNEHEKVFFFVPQEGRPIEGTPRLAQIRSERVPQTALNELMAQAGVKVGDPITEETAKRIRTIASSIDEHFRVTFGGDGKGGVILAIIAP